MRVRHKVNVILTDDADGKDKIFAPDDQMSEVVLDGFTDCECGRFTIAGGQNLNLSLGNLTQVRGIFIKAYSDFNLRLNAGSVLNAHVGNVTPGPSSTWLPAPNATARFFFEGDIGAVNVASPDSNTIVKGIYAVWGDLGT